ncbi:hypothetical protein Tco_1001399, partial [Tanacetum coccineum]
MLNIFYTKIAKIERKKRVDHSVNEPQESVHNDTTNSNKRIMKKRKVVTNIRDIFQGTHHRPSKRLASEKTSSGLRIKKIMRRTTDNKDSLVQHRCSKVSKNEIIETLKSVLDLLRKGPTEVKEIKKENTLETGNSILSRLYVANASVFPRNADIKPLFVRSNDNLVDSKETKVVVSCKNSQPVPRITDVKFYKKKWALEVLVRKTAVMGNNSLH